MSRFMRVSSMITGAIVLLCSPALLLAATNPVSYSVTGTLPAQTTVGEGASDITYTLTNNLPFQLIIKQVARTVNGSGFSFADACSGQALTANGGQCTVVVTFQPTAAGVASVQLSMRYNNNVVALPTLSTTTTSSGTTEISGAVTEGLPTSTAVNTAYPVEFTFTNTGTTSVTASSIIKTGDEADLSNYVDGCTNQALATYGAHCAVTGTFTPSSAGTKSIGVTYNYGSQQSVPLTTITASSGGQPGTCVSVAGSTTLALPTNTYMYADNVVKFKFTNHCANDVATVNSLNVMTTSNGQAVTGLVAGQQDNCLTQGFLAPQASCTILASVIPNPTVLTAGHNLVVTATMNYNQSNQISQQASASTTASSVLANNTTDRMVTIVNQCSVPVWISFQAAAAPGKPTPDCRGSDVCPTGTVCNSGNSLCYFANPALDGQHPDGQMLGVQSGQAPDTMNVTIPENNAGANPLSNVLYNAGIVARLGCTSTNNPKNPLSCIVNNCGGTVTPTDYSTQSDGQCQPGVGASTTPGISFNAVEFTFIKNYSSVDHTTDGVYDEQTINGVNVPMEIKGRGPGSTDSAYSNCQSAGAVIQPTTGSEQTQLGACSYDYTPPTEPMGVRASNYRFVYPGTQSCATSDDQCTEAGQVCGLSYTVNPGHTTYITKMCGTLEGYVSINTGICSQASTQFSDTTLQTLYNCNTKYPDSQTDYFTGANLYACTGTYAGNSCYNPASGLPATSCCGCVDWWNEEGITVPPSPATSSCGEYVNPDWATGQGNVGLVQPQIQWVKQACPTAYAYQYDDPSSSFQCTVRNDSDEIVTNYQVTLCPGGKEVSTLTTD